jgi:hypothetical protein
MLKFTNFPFRLVNWAVSPIPRRYRNIKRYYQPLLDERRRAKADLGDQYEEPVRFS